ncbi:MAG: glycoside-pentoside-hexuronide (GPH):cation symporter [Paracholeplasma sp.]|nr:glycoside-pentoside-hexuronide (GPH):cation symporter [Paracholeplasma sp.]MDY3195334.1 glycoside-pentoside-hexuronide (GPH):cation symporter [Paracholeplasma sp.]
MKNQNVLSFGIGTLGRDMVYTLISMYLTFYLTDVLDLTNQSLGVFTVLIVVVRVFDAFNDPFMGVVVDNTKTRWGKFKPWILIGLIGSAIATLFIFFPIKPDGLLLYVSFFVAYLFWEIFYTMNDIAYWSMMPALSNESKEKEKIGASARIFANIGLFFVVGSIVPLTNLFSRLFDDNLILGYFMFALLVVWVMVIFQLVTLYYVKEKNTYKIREKTKVKEMFYILFKNDQLMITALAMTMFMTGYMITTSFGLHYFKYVMNNEGLYSIFGVILGVSQIIALGSFSYFSKRFSRKQLYRYSTFLVIIGYLLFYFLPTNIIYVGLAALLLFFGQGYLQLLILVFLSDTVEYGHYKLKRRNESVSFSVQPFINKLSGAIASGVVLVTAILSGINEATSASEVRTEGILLIKTMMLIIPLILIIFSFLIYVKFYKIDEPFYRKIVSTIEEREQQK